MNEISLRELVKKSPVFKVDGPNCDFAFAELSYDNQSNLFQHPCRFDGFLTVICLEGGLSIQLNLQSYSLERQMVFFCGPGSIIQFRIPEGQAGPTHLYIAAISDNFVQDLAKDSMKLYNNSKALFEEPFMKLGEKDFATLVGYNEVMDRLLDTGISEWRDAIRSLLASMMHFFRSFWRNRQAQREEVPVHSPRAQAMVDRFIQLVTEHHMTEHYLAFYASKLGITPKYLSKLVREVTGRSAPEWVDSFLVLEAKNMLKYSNLTIKEIVYKMRFPDQSSFYKFFKLHTGMIPSEYRKS